MNQKWHEVYKRAFEIELDIHNHNYCHKQKNCAIHEGKLKIPFSGSQMKFTKKILENRCKQRQDCQLMSLQKHLTIPLIFQIYFCEKIQLKYFVFFCKCFLGPSYHSKFSTKVF